MNNLKSLRVRIKSIKSTKKITKAMQMVSASKLKHARNILASSFDHLNIAEDVIHSFLKQEIKMPPIAKAFFNKKEVKTYLAIIITSDKGLCGSFNQSILRFAKEDLDALERNGCNVKIITIGKKGRDALMNTKYSTSILEHYEISEINSSKKISKIYDNLLVLIQSDSIESCKLYFNSFKNTTTRIQMAKTIMPITEHSSSKREIVDYEYDGENIINKSIEIYLRSVMYNAVVDSRASEEAARMIAMDSATRNAGDMINKLTLSLNRSRQANITNELIEIISGAEAV